MNITDSKIRFMKDGNIYTLLQKDENSKIKFRDGDGVINIATKQEVIENLPYITYHDTVKIYYYLNGECVQLAVKEDVEYPNIYELSFISENEFETTDNVRSTKRFTTIKPLNLEKTYTYVTYNNESTEFTCDENCKINNNVVSLATRDTEIISAVIDHTDDETELTLNNITRNSYSGSMLTSSVISILKYAYDLTNDKTESTLNNAIRTLSGCKLAPIVMDVTHKTYYLTKENASDFTVNNAAIQDYYGTLSYNEVEEV